MVIDILLGFICVYLLCLVVTFCGESLLCLTIVAFWLYVFSMIGEFIRGLL